MRDTALARLKDAETVAEDVFLFFTIFISTFAMRALSLIKYIAVILVAVNVKSLPLVWHARFIYYVVKHLYVLRFRRPSKQDLFKANNFVTHTPLMEIDMNLHKSNSTYFSDLDIARSDLLLHIFKDFFLHYRYRKGSWPFVPLGSVMTIFKREIAAYRPYRIRSRVLGWDQKWLFVLSRFEFLDKNNTLAAVALSKYVFKHKRRTIPPEEALALCGLDDEELLKTGRLDFAHAQSMLDLEAISDVRVHH